jgi:tetratricopeptide (TPR) repeat protein
VSFGTFEDQANLDKIGTEAEQGRLTEGLKYAMSMLEKDPLHIGALVLAAYCMRRLGQVVVAYHFAAAGVREVPNEPALWVNLGCAAHELWLVDEAQHAYNMALRYAKSEKHRAVMHLDISALLTDCGKFDEAEEYCRKVLAFDPKSKSGTSNLGFCQIARHEWVPGWKNYNSTVGGDWLPRVQYGNEPEWKGEKDAIVAIYEDQGLGDAVNFASVLPDAIKDCKKVILDCEPKLYGLFKRSFPGITIYPTRRDTGHTGSRWAKADRDIDYSIPLSQLGQFYRLTDEAFPGAAYLKACPVRSAMWQQHFDAKEKPCIGIAWTGGVTRTNARFRQMKLEDLVPLFRSVDAHWVSLQYKKATPEIEEFRKKYPDIDLVEYPFATLTPDYDDTAAMVSALDHVVCMQTAVGHLAAALGVSTTIFIPTATTWRYYGKSDRIPWYKSMRLVRQKEHGTWADEIRRAADIVAADLPELPEAAGSPACNGELRDGGSIIRPNGSEAHRAVPS